MSAEAGDVAFALRLLMAAAAGALALLVRGPSWRHLGLVPLLALPLTADPRWVFPAGGLALLVPSLLCLDATPAPRRAAGTLAAGLLALGVLAFLWLLPHLPAVTRLYAPAFGQARYASPRQLWAALAVALPLCVLLRVAPRALAGVGRGRLARRVEVALLLSLAALVLGWLGAALGTLPRFVGLPPRIAALAGILASIGWLFVSAALAGFKPCTPAGPDEE